MKPYDHAVLKVFGLSSFPSPSFLPIRFHPPFFNFRMLKELSQGSQGPGLLLSFPKAHTSENKVNPGSIRLEMISVLEPKDDNSTCDVSEMYSNCLKFYPRLLNS
jgi:hypothetical protein